MEKFNTLKKNTTVKAFKLGEEADQLGKKAAQLDRKKDKNDKEANEVRQLRKEAEQLREQQQQAQAMSQSTGLGEKILRGYFTYKMAGLACRTLVGMTGGYYDRDQMVGHAITTGIENATDKMTDTVMKDRAGEGQSVTEGRAQMIEESINSFQRMSDQAAEQGLTPEGQPLLSEDDKSHLQGLAQASRANDVDQYAARSQDLGLDPTEARAAFEQDRSLEAGEQKKDYSMEAEHDASSYNIEI